ncbi:type IV secretory system conjugative DNA transfer family protein [Geothrix fuzhouensis]|uniref:type IV secretory system conjugative DNA transfer family protein n=1 Tax=Geothrix fuzhouensis TaxID=2966451 RepID=UPI002148F9E5|nr:type IV secretion system DNA-binding domain-containing protein [Geothrix fuzhouensis]
MNPITVSQLLRLWQQVSWPSILLGGFGLAWIVFRDVLVSGVDAHYWLVHHSKPWVRQLLHRRSGKLAALFTGLLFFGFLFAFAIESVPFRDWAYREPRSFLWANLGIGSIAVIVLITWDTHPSYLRRGESWASAEFRDLHEDWGRFDRQDGKSVGNGKPVAVLLAYRDCGRKARRMLMTLQRKVRNLTFVFLRWDVLSRHILILGPQGSGKTSAFYGHIMLSATHPWIYQDSKSELPFRVMFPERLVWGLDVRGHETRSGVWNPLQEIRSPDDIDLIVDYVFPTNARDANPWVREMARVLFSAILHSQPWSSLQEISRELRRTRLETFLEGLDSIWKDLLKEPKSQVPILQDLVATLARWEAPRVATITEGDSTVSLDEFITRGGWVMSCEMSDALRTPVHLFWGMLIGRLRNRAEGSAPILLLLDEFGDAGRLPSIERALVLLRSKGVAFVAAIQNLGLMEDVYPQNWKAVVKGFGSKIWLMRNAEDDTRETLSRVLGKWTRRIKPANKHSKETEKEADLVPIDAWGTWSDERAAIARANGWTYWLPLSLPVPNTPLGAGVEAGDPWEEARAMAAMAVEEISQESGESHQERWNPLSATFISPEPIGSGLEMLGELHLPSPPTAVAIPTPENALTQAGGPAITQEEEWL